MVAPDTPHTGTAAPEGVVALDIFAPPRAYYRAHAQAQYWRVAQEVITPLHFTLDHTLWDPERPELVMVYTAALNRTRTLTCELFRFGSSGEVIAGDAMYGITLA